MRIIAQPRCGGLDNERFAAYDEKEEKGEGQNECDHILHEEYTDSEQREVCESSREKCSERPK